MSEPSVAVIGAGPAGMAAAAAAAQCGARVRLLDEAARAGGQIDRQPRPGLGAALPGSARAARRRALLDGLRRHAERIEHVAEASVYALAPDLEIRYARDGATHRMRPGAVVVAAGVSEYSIPFPGWTLPGVGYAGGLQALLKEQGVLAGRRIAIAGAGPLPLAVAAQLRAAGAGIACVALYTGLEAMAWHPRALASAPAALVEGACHLARLAGVPVLSGWVPVRAEGDAGGVCRLTLARREADGTPRQGTGRTFEADAVGLGFGLAPNTELLRLAGAAIEFDDGAGGWVPRRADSTETTVEGLFAAGDCAGVRGALAAEAEGTLAGLAAAGAIGRPAGAGRERAARARRDRRARFHRAVAETLVLGPGAWRIGAAQETIVCRCEGVTRAAIEAAAPGQPDLDAVKRLTRAGMGPCGGRGCARALAALCGAASPAPPRARPPARPVSIGALAALAEDGER